MPASSKPRLPIQPGAPVPLPQGVQAWRVQDAPVEVYLVGPERRRLIAVVEPGGHVFGIVHDTLSLQMVAGEASGEAHALRDVAESARHWMEQAAGAAGVAVPRGAADADAVAAFTIALDAVFARADAERDAALSARLSGEDMPHDGARSLADALKQAALALGGDVERESVLPHTTDFALAPSLARRYGLRAARVILDGHWAEDDRGPLLLRERGTQAVRFAVWRPTGYVDASGDPLDGAAQDTLAWRVYGPLSDDVSTMRGMMKSVLRGLMREWKPVAGAALLAALLGLIAPWTAGWIFDVIVPGGERGLLVAAGLALFAAALVTVVLSAVRALAISRVRGRGMLTMMAGLSDHVLRLPARFFRTVSAGDFAQRLASVEMVRTSVTELLLNAGLTSVFALLYLGQLLLFDTRLALAGLALTLIYVTLTVIFRTLQVRPATLAAERDGKLASLTYEMLEGVAKLRTAAAEGRMLARWQTAYAAERDAAAASDRIEAHYRAFEDSWSLLTMAGLFATAALLAQADLSAGQLIAFLAAFGLFQGAFTQLCDGLMSLWSLQPIAERARPILTAPAEARAGRADPGRLQGHIAANGLSFAYDGANVPIIDGLDLEVKPGEHLAIVGGSGSGKSTILRLLLGFEAPLTGSITYDGQDFSSLDPARVRSQIGVVLQSSQLFAGSIQENIKGASDATLEHCLAAAEAAGLARDLKLFPMGLHTPITEGAGTLSGGQRQRILIARALAGSPRILFLDEATSALDNATQAVVAETMDALNATRITIAHRLSTVRNANRIAVLEKGRFVESGDFESLMAKNGAFAQLARRQLLED